MCLDDVDVPRRAVPSEMSLIEHEEGVDGVRQPRIELLARNDDLIVTRCGTREESAG